MSLGLKVYGLELRDSGLDAQGLGFRACGPNASLPTLIVPTQRSLTVSV